MKKDFNKAELNIILDALLHEMQRYNEALLIVSDSKAIKAIEAAKERIYQVFTKVNSKL